MSITGASELEFDFDDTIVNSKVYRRVLASANKAIPQSTAEVLEGDLIDLTENQPITQAHVKETTREFQSLMVSQDLPRTSYTEADFDLALDSPMRAAYLDGSELVYYPRRGNVMEVVHATREQIKVSLEMAKKWVLTDNKQQLAEGKTGQKDRERQPQNREDAILDNWGPKSDRIHPATDLPWLDESSDSDSNSLPELPAPAGISKVKFRNLRSEHRLGEWTTLQPSVQRIYSISVGTQTDLP